MLADSVGFVAAVRIFVLLTCNTALQSTVERVDSQLKLYFTPLSVGTNATRKI